MFKDKDRELQRLEEALLAQEEDELLQEDREEYDTEENWDCCAYNADNTDVDLESYSEEVWQEPKHRLSGLVTLACCLSIAILLVLLYLFLRFGGYL